MSATGNAPVFELAEVGYRYPDGRSALETVTMRISAGENVALLGPNGSGKTTLLLNLVGLLTPTSGEIRAFGEPLRHTAGALKALRARVGIVFQNPDSQLLSASVAEDVSFGPINLGLPETTVRERVREALAAVEMSDFADVPAHALSFGQKKRVCIAGVLAMHPEVLLLDEPTAGLDARSLEDLLGVLDALHDRGMTVVMSTHDVDLAYAWADRAEVLDDGCVAGSFPADQFADQFGRFVPCGLGRPRVAEVYAAARRAGLAGYDRVPPRTHEALLAAFEEPGGAIAAAAPDSLEEAAG